LNTQKARTWAEIDLGALEHNYKVLGEMSGAAKLLGVVKADAYGHGAVEVSKRLVGAGCGYLGVACLDEAVRLREADVGAPILIFGHTPREYTGELLRYGITQTLCCEEAASEYAAWIAEVKRGNRAGARLRAHIKLDTGMGRLGRWETCGLARALGSAGLDIEGVYTHFAQSEDEESAFTHEQLSLFTSIVDELEMKTGYAFKIRHCANSGAVINYRESHLDMVRPGISLYGYHPAAHGGKPVGLRRVMSLRTRVMQTRSIDAGLTVSYGRKFTAAGRTEVAVLPVGYADGLPRSLSGRMEFIINGRRARQIGVICMDACMADVTGIPGVTQGSVATVIGRDGDETITADDLAAAAGTISHEILTSVSRRVKRVYI
jgi:alanine racemase